ncbi:MAG: Phosphoserine phosphatase (EC [uncultured Thiotrichaceae bacterium]|uniref:Phosphoserine phosphatase (EC) n=1 Tax=uncultured Thiotrichaceae bacterium TaxID=298394 RepID=A0A6S6SMU2_9GAMM|nr:MAG: Phosphoserine phosphatase (EC [uncultured Thiotrichaceae bacterium]
MKAIAFFDFDGTISTRDSLWCFLRHTFGARLVLKLAQASPYILLFKAKLMKNDVAKANMFRVMFGDIAVRDFDAYGSSYSNESIQNIVKESALDKIQWHKEQGHEVVVVSASLKNWLQPWCEKQEVKLLCTQFTEDAGKMKWEYNPANCHGPAKVDRIKASYDLEQFDKIYAYGDSSGDTEMLAIADEPHYRVFK